MRSEKGFTLVEVLVGLALLAIIGVAILNGMGTIFKSSIVANTQTTGMGIAQSQLEYTAGICNPIDPTDKVGYYNTTSVPSGYTIWTIPRGTNSDGTGQPVQCRSDSTDPKTGLIGIPWDDQSGSGHNIAISAASSTDNNIQKITVIVKQGDRIVTTLSAFRVKQ